MTEYEFVDELPGGPKKSRRVAHLDFADALRQRPGQWAKWPDTLSDLTAEVYSHSIARGIPMAFRGGEFEGALRDGQLYVRFVGKGGVR